MVVGVPMSERQEKAEIESKLVNIDASMGERLEQRLVILELSQKAAQIYRSKSPEHKQLIVSKLFEDMTIKGGTLSVKHTKFAQAIAENVSETHKIMEATK
jgi:hypothetical protein